MSLVVLIIVTVLLILGLGILILFLMRRSQKVVPDVADRQVAESERASQETEAAPRDDAAFEDVLKGELKDLGR